MNKSLGDVCVIQLNHITHLAGGHNVMLVEDGARLVLVSPYRIRLQYCHNLVQANYLWQWRCTIKYIGAFSYVLQREGHQSVWGMGSKIERYHIAVE